MLLVVYNLYSYSSFFSFQFVNIYPYDNYVLKYYFVICYIFYYYELKFMYSNDLIWNGLNLNNTQHQISLQKGNGIRCNCFKLLGSYVILTNNYSQKANGNSLLRKSFLVPNNSSTKHQFSLKRSCKQTPP